MNICISNCLDSYQAKINYKIQDTKKNNFENFILKKHYNKEKVVKVREKNSYILETDAIILEHKVNQDYSEKYLYTPLSAETKVGDIYFWERTNTYWIVYASYLTEKSYNKSIIKRANWCISWKDENENIYNQWVYVRGPVETKLNQYKSNNNIIDLANGTLTILMPNNERTKFFTKYKTVMLNNKKWKIVADEDDISNPELREVQLEKIAININNDDIINNLVDGLDIENINFNILFKDTLSLNCTLDINNLVIISNKNKIIPNNFKINLISGKAYIKQSKITFNTLGKCEFKIIHNNNPIINKIITVNVVEEDINEIKKYKILGENRPKTFFTYNYSTELINLNDIIKWNIIDNNNIVSHFEVQNNLISIKYGHIGNIILQLLVNDEQVDSMNIQVVGTFE